MCIYSTDLKKKTVLTYIHLQYWPEKKTVLTCIHLQYWPEKKNPLSLVVSLSLPERVSTNQHATLTAETMHSSFIRFWQGDNLDITTSSKRTYNQFQRKQCYHVFKKWSQWEPKSLCLLNPNPNPNSLFIVDSTLSSQASLHTFDFERNLAG